jgi:hypothetical protein
MSCGLAIGLRTRSKTTGAEDEPGCQQSATIDHGDRHRLDLVTAIGLLVIQVGLVLKRVGLQLSSSSGSTSSYHNTAT